jgi:hypothetical protein
MENQSRSVITRRGREKKRLLPPNIPTTFRFIYLNEQLLLNPSCYLMGEMGEILYLKWALHVKWLIDKLGHRHHLHL